jgi:GntR family transcriptional regulator
MTLYRLDMAHEFTDLDAGPVPLWFQIAARLRKDVQAGKFAAGDRLPSESELNAMYGVSRTTARSALDRLEQEGLITRRPGKGSIVLPPHVDQQLKTFAGFADEMRSRGLRPSYDTRSIRRLPATADVAKNLKINRREPVLTVDRVLLADGYPMATSQSWISPRVLKDQAAPKTKDLNARSLYAWIEAVSGVRIVGGDETVEAVNANEDIAGRLRVSVGAATLVAHRLSRSKNHTPVEYVVIHYRADRYRFSIGWRRPD